MGTRRASKVEGKEADRIRYEIILAEFQKTIGYRFIHLEYLREALRHSSYAADLETSGKKKESNERLEFLGDAVIELAVREELFRLRPEDDEGKMSLERAWLVGEHNLARAAERIQVGKVLKVGLSSFGREPTRSMMADAFEAVVGAVYVDRGPAKAFEFIRLNLFEDGAFGRAAKGFNAKTRLKELCEVEGVQRPAYDFDSFGPDHARKFRCTARALGCEGSGEGQSKSEAEEQAALALIECYRGRG
jgi:ribonuclease III